MEVRHPRDGIQLSERTKAKKCVWESDRDTPLSYLQHCDKKRIVAVYWENSIPDELPGNREEADRKESLTGWRKNKTLRKKTH